MIERASMLYRLIILNGERRSERITVTQAPMTIGRAPTCEIRFDDPEIALAHAEISHRPEGLFIRDLGSMNRVLVNNREVHESHPKHGDVIEVGHTRFLVQAYVQAEVQGEDTVPYHRRPWIWAAGALAAAAILALSLHRCAPAPRPRQVPARKPAAVTPPRAVPARAAPAAAVPAAPVPAQTGTVAAADTAATPSPAGTGALPEEQVPPAGAAAGTNELVPAMPDATEAALLMARPGTNATAEVIAAAQKDLEDAANALLDSKVRDMLEDARALAATNGPDAAEPVFASIEKLSPGSLEAAVAHATVLEEQGKLEPALALWNDVARRAGNTAYAEQAGKKTQQLVRARTELVFPFVGRIKIVDATLSKFPETDPYREMRLLNLRLVATELQKEIDAGAVRVEVRFYDRVLAGGAIAPTAATVSVPAPPVAGPWRAAEEKTVQVSYVVPAAGTPAERPAQYHGFAARVYYFGALQDERTQPKDLPADVELAAPDAAPATNPPAAAPTNTGGAF